MNTKERVSMEKIKPLPRDACYIQVPNLTKDSLEFAALNMYYKMWSGIIKIF